MAQREQRPVEDVGRDAMIHEGAIAEKIDLEVRKVARPVFKPRLGRMARADEEPAMQAIGRDRVGRPNAQLGKID